MGMKQYRMDIDVFCDEVFDKLEEISIDDTAHECAVQFSNKREAAQAIANALVPFIEEQLEEVQDDLLS